MCIFRETKRTILLGAEEALWEDEDISDSDSEDGELLGSIGITSPNKGFGESDERVVMRDQIKGLSEMVVDIHTS